jgi:hypothetical protein
LSIGYSCSLNASTSALYSACIIAVKHQISWAITLLFHQQ